MAVDIGVARSRRALLAGGVGGMAALVASALGRPLAARAGTDGDVVLGSTNIANDTTAIRYDMSQDVAFAVSNAASDYPVAIAGSAEYGTGVVGGTWTRTGVHGDAMGIGIGVHGSSGSRTGVYGVSGDDSGAPATNPVAGVYGYCAASSGKGVYGQAAGGRGVQGDATSGTGGYFNATTGTALRAVGRVKLDKCAGVATIPATKSSVTVTPGIDLVSTSAVVATLMGNAGGSTTVKRVAVNTTTNTLTIYLTAASNANVKVAWHVFG